MPDTSHQRERVDEFERYAVATGKKGGVLLTRNKKAYTVNIRPQRWSDKHTPAQFWKGKLTTLESAMFLADAVFHYCGRHRFHFGDAPFPFPNLACMGNDDTTPAQRSAYVQSIAGEGFRPQREEFIQQLKNVTESEDFIQKRETFLNLRNVQVAAHPPPTDEAAPDNADPTDEAAAAADSSSGTDETGGDECETPLEDDLEAVAMARGLVASSQVANVAGFGFNVGRFDAGKPAKILESVEQHLHSEFYDFCAAENGWIVAIDELNKKSAMPAGSSDASNATEPIPEPVFPNISFMPGTNFVVVEPVLCLDSEEENQLALTPHVQSHGPLSCPPSLNSASLLQSCELNRPFGTSSANMALSVDDDSASPTSARRTKKNAKRQKTHV